MTIRDVFKALDRLPWDHVVYCAREPITLATECLVLDPSDADPDRDVPKEAASLSFTSALAIEDIRDIRTNAQLQGKLPTDDELLAAYVYYLSNDAFIRF